MTYILIALLAASIILLGSYIFAINIIYKKSNNSLYDMRNTFIYEVAPHYKTALFSINFLLYLSLASTLVGVILFASRYIDVLPVFLVIASLIYLVSLGFISQISLNKLKEHLYLSMGSIIGLFASSGLLTYLSYSLLRLYDYQNVTLIISLVVSGLILLGALIVILNPKIFNLKMETNEKGETVRPRTITLAYSEWTLLLLSITITVPLILISTVI